MLKYTVFADRAMTKIKHQVETKNPAIIRILNREMQKAGIKKPTLPVRLPAVGIEVTEL